MFKINLIAAIAKNYCIGNNGGIPWHIPADMKHFREMTLNNVVIMGRRTFESMGSNPLTKRLNIIITSTKPNMSTEFITTPHRKPGSGSTTHIVRYFNSLQQALEYIEFTIPPENQPTKVFIIGGSRLYKEALPLADKLYLTEINQPFKGDTFFPEFNKKDFIVTESEEDIDEATGLTFFFNTYQRLPKSYVAN